MSVNCQTFDQSVSQTGWSSQDYPPGGPYTDYVSGTQALYTIQSALENNKTYYWDSYARDPGGTDTWSSTQGTPYSFTTVPLGVVVSEIKGGVKVFGGTIFK